MKIENIPDGKLVRGGRYAFVFLAVDEDNDDEPLDCTDFTLETKFQDLSTGRVLFTIANADHSRADGVGTGDKVTAALTPALALWVPGHAYLGTCRRTDSGHEYPLWRGQGTAIRLAGD